jgi:DNA-binding MarR family transcriptional regulator
VDKNDRRRANLRLTAEGRKVHKDLEESVLRVERELRVALDANEFVTLRQSLDKPNQQLESP